MAEKPFAWLMVCLMWTGPVWGFSVAPKIDCPVQFRGLASEAKEIESSVGVLNKQKVMFTVTEALKGVIKDTMEIELLKFGPLNIEIGRQYFVQLNQGKLCWLEIVD